MKIVLTVVLAAIILAAVWSGYRRGLILSAAQLAAIVVAFYGAALLAGQVSDRLLPVAEPFAGGYFEGQLDVVAAGLPDNDAGLSGEDWVDAHPDTAQEYAEQCFAAAGVSGRAGQRMARQALALRDGERKAHGLPRLVIGILPQNDYLYLFKRTSIVSMKNPTSRRENRITRIFLFHKSH